MQREFEKENIQRTDEILKILNKVYQNFTQGLFDPSIELLEEALEIDFEYPGIASALKCANFWRERLTKLDEIYEFYEKGEFLIKQWEIFAKFSMQIGDTSERCLFNIKQYVFNSALENYLKLLEESQLLDHEILLKIGKCYKGLGNYECAIESIETALGQKPDSAWIMAELADCYSLVNDLRLSKIFFREAFFLDPRAINLESLESGMIKKLVQTVTERGIPEARLPEWIPVYGIIFGVFNVKRELKSLEIGKLKQAVFQMEKDLGNHEGDRDDLIPRLINNYFWLIDHYVSCGEEKSKIEEILSKIKEIDYTIYKEYTN